MDHAYAYMWHIHAAWAYMQHVYATCASMRHVCYMREHATCMLHARACDMYATCASTRHICYMYEHATCMLHERACVFTIDMHVPTRHVDMHAHAHLDMRARIQCGCMPSRPCAHISMDIDQLKVYACYIEHAMQGAPHPPTYCLASHIFPVTYIAPQHISPRHICRPSSYVALLIYRPSSYVARISSPTPHASTETTHGHLRLTCDPPPCNSGTLCPSDFALPSVSAARRAAAASGAWSPCWRSHARGSAACTGSGRR